MGIVGDIINSKIVILLLKISFFNENGKSIKQYCYHDGVVIEVEENGSIFVCYLMLKDELDSLLKLSNDVERVGSQIIKGAKGWKERSNK